MTTAATATRPTPRKYASHSNARPSQRPSATSYASSSRVPTTSTLSPVPQHTPTARSPQQQQQQREKLTSPQTPSPNYFGLVVEASKFPADSNPGEHVQKNWATSTSSVQSTAAISPQRVTVDGNPAYEAFRKQSESNKSFSLSHGNLERISRGASPPTLGAVYNVQGARQELFSPRGTAFDHVQGQPSSDDDMQVDEQAQPEQVMLREPEFANEEPSFFDIPRNTSPLAIPTNVPPGTSRPDLKRSQLSFLDDRHPRLSLPHNRIDPPSPGRNSLRVARAETLPTPSNVDGPILDTVQDISALMENNEYSRYLLLDLRVSPQYALSRIKGAMNLCIPTTLLKRPSFNVAKLAETFADEDEKARFSQWKSMKHIVVYDSSSAQLKDATSCVNTLRKFVTEGWKGRAHIIRGGFHTFSQQYPDLLDRRPPGEGENGRSNLSIDPKVAALPVVGGCPMPATKQPANPFFGNIRQNMDLVDGVGQMPIKRPAVLTERSLIAMPRWIADVTEESDNGKAVADKFLRIERDEQARMQKALTGNVQYGSPRGENAADAFQIAGIEKGTKNRYKDILPFDHTRVRLQNISPGGCDYVNASHVKAKWSHRHYIASQAPVPATFEDFWSMIWEQDARVLVMLTAQQEGGQLKCHPYWLPNSYGQLKVKAISEKRVSLEPSAGQSRQKSSDQLNPPLTSPLERASASRRRATNPLGASIDDVVNAAAASTSSSEEKPHLIVRKLALSHASFPFQPIREITQLQYSSWPDLGVPANPAQVLTLIEHCNAVVRSYAGRHSKDAQLPAPPGERPIVVHCSAGCGRTGTFCTIDSVLDMLKRQKQAAMKRQRRAAAARSSSSDSNSDSDEQMDVDDDDADADELAANEWVTREDIDLVAKAVEDFRTQRLSMVQTLRQFVLCYEAVLEWLCREMPERFRKEGARRSYQG